MSGYYPSKTIKNKLFVGQLLPEVTGEQLKTFFLTYGEVQDATVQNDSLTGRSRGFGFVTFASADTVTKILSEHALFLDGQRVEVKIAYARDEPITPIKTKKAFVSGLSLETQEAGLRTYFEQYGVVEDVMVMRDRENRTVSRGFGFVTFGDEETLERVLSVEDHQLKGRGLKSKKQNPGPENQRAGTMVDEAEEEEEEGE
eukprot:CAMPEP_0201537646 /NCGR_PEP_ID=MMETSP0161_2-20130828/65386_1 /ASSEMBLY_ACC=CAM_ASM_000251 /TAXON_ID=180227 /ORGANISM="Neoparamoeba aestuarina, Strain SoJaBio B1-5/56/2" /LENGTH=200 /DNA_ID=CAMNT_0047944059 /DNA_START=143 /DNA_END=743 /DNA_ORIENTATION=+